MSSAGFVHAGLQGKTGLELARAVVAVLRSEHGCPWDREQTLDSLRPFLLEEAHELLDAMSGEPAAHCEELGDVLLQVLLQAQIRHEEETFSIEDVASALAEKLIRRHPHVFGDVCAADSAAVIRNWEQIKAREKPERTSVLDGLPAGLPALLQAQRMQRRAARIGFDWPDTTGVLEKIREEIGEVQERLAQQDAHAVREELGDLLFSLVNLARHLGVEAEDALLCANRKFSDRFRYVEQAASQAGRALTSCSLEELDVYWEQAKRAKR